MNVPYEIKKHGLLEGNYMHQESNRRERRSVKQKQVFLGNVKHISLTISGKLKYKRHVQIIGKKRILHYLPLN